MNKIKLVLASTSPRRKDLLKLLGLDFEIIPPANVEANTPYIESVHESFSQYVEDIAFLKAKSVAEKIKFGGLIIGADTIVVINNKILGKPKTEEDAYNMLKILNNRWHKVFTGLVIIDKQHNKFAKSHEISKVKFKKLQDEEIRAYIKTKEPMDKAGSYALQGIGAIFVEKIQGCYTNVIGLPLALLDNLLKKFFNFSILL